MYHFYQHLNVKPGTVIYKSKGVYDHAALVAGESIGSLLPVISLTPEGVLEEFWDLTSTPIRIGDYPSALPSWVVLANARSMIGTKYHLTDNNCEHFVELCHQRPSASRQVRNTVAVVAGVALLLVIVKAAA